MGVRKVWVKWAISVDAVLSLNSYFSMKLAKYLLNYEKPIYKRINVRFI